MMTRRNFIKKMAVFFSFIPLGAAGFLDWLSRTPAKPKPEPAPPQAETPAEQKPKAVSTEPLASIFLFSDMHISVSEPSMTEKLHWALKDVTNFESPVDSIVFGGDLTDFGRASDYALLRRTLDQYTLPQQYGNMGNHDYYDIWLDKNGAFSTETVPNGKTDAQSRARFQTFFGYTKPYNEAYINGVHILLVSQELYYQEKPEVGEGAWYSDEQLNWLEEKMKSHQDGKPVLVFIHQPLPDPGLDGRTHQLIRANEFRRILKPYKNVFVISGHTHLNFVGDPGRHYNEQNSFHWFINSSVGRARSNDVGGTTSMSQGMYIQVFEDRVVVRGREFSNKTWINDANWTVPLT
ncbi:metallophosphoesterase family protein [Paenibacillus thalictri]|uniref:Metallophosphoesterase n=1 Tax=Paenibacillus thalictri TaxID=2527873 RepID=A0A4Q9E0B7_9BACL|nr:metallophosphoesterase [Paenibacillus thalictri]TBL81573.1 metallophosphoesterase [Paenibacillus thalictri]